MNFSAQNQFPGRVTDIKNGVAGAVVHVDIGDGKHMTSFISTDSLKELNLQTGDRVVAIVKSTSVMLGV